MNIEMKDIDSIKGISTESLLSGLRSVNCTILQKGYKKYLNDYILCSCDPDLQDPICEDCYNKCHFDHEIIQRIKLRAICSCGSKGHKINNASTFKEGKSISGKCFIMDWNNTINSDFYYYEKRTNKRLCYFCINYCDYEIEDLSKQNYSLRDKTNGSDICDCDHKNHLDNKILLKKLRDSGDPKNLYFENISKTHLFNLIVRSEKSFNMLFNNYRKFIDQFKNKLDNSATAYLTDTTINQTFNLYLNVLGNMMQKSNRLNYFNTKITQDFNQSFIISLMNTRTEYKSLNVWNFKLNLISIFINGNFKKDLVIVPNMTVKDIELLNPFQRLMFFNNIKAQNEIMSKYINNLKFNFLEFTLKTLNNLNSLKEKFSVSYKLMRKLFNICKTYAKFNLFNYDQAIKYTNLIEEVLAKLCILLKNFQDEDRLKDSLLEEQIMIMKPIVKSLIYLSYSYNDQLIEKYFKAVESQSANKTNLNNFKFFNSNLELTKFISKNIINCFTNLLNNSNYTKFRKQTKDIVSNIFSILKTFLYTRDGYSTGLKRILNKNNSLFFNYVTDNLTTNECYLVNETRNLTNEIEKAYLAFFNFEIEEKDIINILKNCIKKIFDLMNLSKYKQANVVTENMPSSFSENESDRSNNFNYIVLSQAPDKYTVYPRQKTLNVLTRNEIINENVFDKSENNQLKVDPLKMEKLMIKNFDVIGKFKMLINKSFFIFSITKIIKISHEKFNQKINLNGNENENIIKDDTENYSEPHDSDNLNFAIEESLFSEILKLLYFYIENNEDNSINLLSSDFLETFVLLNNNQLNDIFGVIYTALKNIVKLKYELANHEYILKFFKNILKKIKLNPQKFNKDFKIFLKIMKLLKLLTKINFMNENSVSHKIRKFIVHIFNKFSIISEFIEYLKEFKNQNLRTSEYDTDLFSEIDIKGSYKNKQNLIMIDENQDELNKNRNNIKNYNEKINVDNYQNNYEMGKNHKKNTGHFYEDINDCEFKGIKVKELCTILRYFLFLTNLLYDGDATLDKKEFLFSIFQINDIYHILKRKNLEIELRKEILKFFRMVFVDVILEKKKIVNYLYVMVDKKLPNKSENNKIISFSNSDLNNLFNYLNDLIAVNENSSVSDFEFEILKHELLIEEEVIDKNKSCEDFLKLEYLIEGIVLPLKTFMGKFMSKQNKFTGKEYLKLYELVYYFLNLKNKIIKNANFLSLLKIRYSFKDIFNISDLKTVENFIPIKKYYTQSEIEELNKDLNTLRNPAFEFYQFEWLIQLYNKHMDSFLITTKADSLKKEFLKKNIQFDEETTLNFENKLTTLGFLKTTYEKQAFNLIISYYNSKRDLSNSGFINILEDNNLQYSNSYRYLIIRSIFYILREENYKEEYLRDCFWTWFKLIQYDTESVQKEVIKLCDEPIDLVQLKELIFFFLENLISIIFMGCNPSILNLNGDYFLAMNIIKVLKYLCEDHNKEFQRIFFKEINLLNSDKLISTSEDVLINRDFLKKSPLKSDLYFLRQKNLKKEDQIEAEKENDEEQYKDGEEAKSIHNIFKKINGIKFKENTYEENFQNVNNNNHHKNYNENNVKLRDTLAPKENLSTFELMLDIVNKMIVFAQWNVVDYGTEESNVSYYYDIFSVIIEFLIEMVQGTEASNLESLINKKKDKGENDYKIVLFFQNIKQILLRDETDSDIVYQVRKDLIDFICAFIEEKSTPEKLIKIISNIFNPFMIFSSLINTMKKLYIRLSFEGTKIKDKKYLDKNYQQIKFDSNMGNFFLKKFYDGKTLSENQEFELANRMYQYLKILASEYSNQDAIEIFNFINVSSAVIKRHEQFDGSKLKKNNGKQEKSDRDHIIDFHLLGKIDENNYDENYEEEIYYIHFSEKYEAVKFFEKITRTVMVQNNRELVRVVFTINPLIYNLSQNTKNDFILNVNRETRYIKLFSLMEYCDYFYDELIYNSKFSDSNFLMKVFKKVNYYNLEFICFVIIFIINVMMMSSLEEKEVVTGDSITSEIIEILTIINICFSSFVSFVWFYSKFPLYWIIDSKKLALKLNIPVECLDFWKKTKIFRNVIFLRNEIVPFLWHLIFSAIAISDRKNHFLFSVQILIMVNLSSILKNIVKSITLRYKQLLVILSLFVISNYQFGVFAFYFFGEDFVTTFYRLDADGFPEKYPVSQNQCGSNLYCFITHLDYGLRSDGGIGEYIPKRSMNRNPAYYMGRFLHNTLYFIIVNVILFSILMGIIIDTFAELREMTSKKEEDMAHVCFICGDVRENLEKKSKNFLQHVNKEHNIWTYAEYIIGLKFLDPQEVNAINSYVIGTVQQKAISWFPYAESDETDKNPDGDEEH